MAEKFENKLKLLTFENLSKPSSLDRESSNISVNILSLNKIVVGNEEGCFVTDFCGGNNIIEVSRLKNREVSSVIKGDNCEENLLFAASKKEIYLFDLRLPLDECVHMFHENEDEINQIKRNEINQYLASCDDSGETKLFDLRMRNVLKTLRKRHSNICMCLSFSSKVNGIFTGGLDSQIIHWDIDRLKPIQFINTQEILNQMGDNSVYMANPPHIYSMDISENGLSLACGLGNGSLQIFDMMKESSKVQPTKLINKHSTLGIPSVNFVKQNKENSDAFLVTGGNDGYIHLWERKMLRENVSTGKKGKRRQFPNQFLTPDEVEEMCLYSYKNCSKITAIDTKVVDDKLFIVFTDQSAIVKYLTLNL